MLFRSYQNLPYKEQVELKERQIRELLASVCPEVGGCRQKPGGSGSKVGEDGTGGSRSKVGGVRWKAAERAGEGTGQEEISSMCADSSRSAGQKGTGKGAGCKWQGLRPSPISDGYRNKMEFSFGDAYKGGPLALGMISVSG